MSLPEIKQAEMISKNWGGELLIYNGEKYCGKILFFDKNKKSSLHFHVLKQESWLVRKGKFELTLIQGKDASIHKFIIEPFQTITLLPGQIHKLVCLEEGEIIEVSTTDYPTDSIRIQRGD